MLFAALLLPLAVSASNSEYLRMTMDQVIRKLARSKHPQFVAFGTLMQSSCGQGGFADSLANPNVTNTLFLPTDGALLASLNPPVPLRGFSCAPFNASSCAASPLPLSGIQYPTPFLLPCLPSILQMHLIPGESLTLPSLNATSVHRTALDGQSLVIEQNGTNSTVRFAAMPPAQVVSANLACANGNIQIIDRLMLPAGNLTRSLDHLNLIALAQTLRFRDQEAQLAGLEQSTYLLPISGERLNLSFYTIPGPTIWNNRTGNLQLTTLAGTPLRLSLGPNMTVEGQPVKLANIPIANGVLHLIESPLPNTAIQ